MKVYHAIIHYILLLLFLNGIRDRLFGLENFWSFQGIVYALLLIAGIFYGFLFFSDQT